MQSGGLYISIHVPREGDDASRTLTAVCNILFQSTSPVRGTTARDVFFADVSELFQSTSPVRGTTRPQLPSSPLAVVSIHVPREGDDEAVFFIYMGRGSFNPRPP